MNLYSLFTLPACLYHKIVSFFIKYSININGELFIFRREFFNSIKLFRLQVMSLLQRVLRLGGEQSFMLGVLSLKTYCPIQSILY